MVHLVIKRNDDILFQHTAPVATKIQDLIDSVTSIHNKKLRLKRLIDTTDDIIQYGLMRPDQEQGYSIEEIESNYSTDAAATDSRKGTVIIKDGFKYIFNPDPTGRRTGESPCPEIAETLTKTVEAAKSITSKEFAASSTILTHDMLDEAIRNIGGAITIAYPMGLPEWEPVKYILEDDEDLTGSAASKEVIESADASLWWANKELVREKLLSDFVGKNEKTKLIVKLQKKAQGAPVREAPMDEKAQRELMAYYYKKQEEHKKLVENNDDDYVNSSWANPKTLKNHFNGMGSGISWRPT